MIGFMLLAITPIRGGPAGKKFLLMSSFSKIIFISETGLMRVAEDIGVFNIPKNINDGFSARDFSCFRFRYLNQGNIANGMKCSANCENKSIINRKSVLRLFWQNRTETKTYVSQEQWTSAKICESVIKSQLKKTVIVRSSFNPLNRDGLRQQVWPLGGHESFGAFSSSISLALNRTVGSSHFVQLTAKNPSLIENTGRSSHDEDKCKIFPKTLSAILAAFLFAIGLSLPAYGVYKSREIGGWAALIVVAGFPPFLSGVFFLLNGVFGWGGEIRCLWF